MAPTGSVRTGKPLHESVSVGGEDERQRRALVPEPFGERQSVGLGEGVGTRDTVDGPADDRAQRRVGPVDGDGLDRVRRGQTVDARSCINEE